MFYHQPANSLSADNYNALFYTDTSWSFHFHKSLEIIYVIKGSVTCTVNDVTEKLFASDFGLCLPNEIHSYTPNADSLYWVCVFSADHVRAFSNQIYAKTSNTFMFRASESVESFIKANLISTDKPQPNMLKACLYALCNEYINSVELYDKDTAETRTMGIIADFVSKHHKENITLNDIAGLLGYEYHYVSRYFNKIFKIPFSEFLNLHRLDSAIQLMEADDKKLVNIAYESGFRSVRTFNDCFKKHFHMSPSEYKK